MIPFYERMRETFESTKVGIYAAVGEWWARQDSNLRPEDYESPALTN